MELGEKLRQARLEAGLSQRQLCGEEITRNMLSLIEHGSAKPSMDTLKYLAARLGKPMSYFLDEEAVTSPNQSVMDSARRLYDAGSFSEAALVLEAYREPDAVYDRERQLLWALTHLELARQAMDQRRNPYALTLLEKAAVETAYCGEELNRRRLLLLGKIPGQRVSEALPSLDEELRLRAREALASGDPQRAAKLLEAAENRDLGEWNLLRGQVCLAQRAYQEATLYLHLAEKTYPQETAPMLERCYRELKNYQQAYAYACKFR